MIITEKFAEYSIVIAKNCNPQITTAKIGISVETLLSDTKSNIIINPIYELVNGNNEQIHLKRRREVLAWELEVIMMQKVLPREIIIDKNTIDDIKNRRITTEIIKLLKNGIILEVPAKFAGSKLGMNFLK